MVKLYALNILYKIEESVRWLKTSYELSSFGFFQRTPAREFMAFVSKTIVERTHLAARQSVKEGDYMCHVYVRADGLAAVVISDEEYPPRVAHTLLTKVLDEFTGKVPVSEWGNEENLINYELLPAHLAKYQVPAEADTMTKIEQDLNETKIVMHSTMSALLDRKEKLDDLVAKSNDLTLQSKAFYKTARKTNSCCKY